MADMQMEMVLAGKKIEPQYVEMKVPLYSHGCAKKIRKALSHLRGIHSVQVDYQQQKVTVWGICNKDDVLAAVRKKRRGSRFWGQEESDVACAVAGEETRLESAQKHYLAAFTAYRYRKSWKKLFPLIRL